MRDLGGEKGKESEGKRKNKLFELDGQCQQQEMITDKAHQGH